MKKQWTSPRILVQEFEANEYVAACWGVACDYEWANWYDREHPDTTHDKGHCGFVGHQVLIDSDDNGTPESMIEVGTDGLGELKCTIFEDSNYSQQIPPADVSVGEIIYWTTSAGSRTWHHKGIVEATVPGHPNRS